MQDYSSFNARYNMGLNLENRFCRLAVHCVGVGADVGGGGGVGANNGDALTPTPTPTPTPTLPHSPTP